MKISFEKPKQNELGDQVNLFFLKKSWVRNQSQL